MTMITVKLKCPKEQRDGKAVLVDVFESGGPICPVKAFCKWKLLAKCEGKKPAFRAPCGTPLTGRKLNGYVKELLKGSIDYAEGQLTGHSFRSGIASLLGSKGFSDEEIKQVGRWSSSPLPGIHQVTQNKTSRHCEENRTAMIHRRTEMKLTRKKAVQVRKTPVGGGLKMGGGRIRRDKGWQLYIGIHCAINQEYSMNVRVCLWQMRREIICKSLEYTGITLSR
jgi:hypothetical protein